MKNYSLIKKVFERDIHKNVISINECENQILNINNVFKIETEDKPFIFKMYRSVGYPEDGKMVFVSQKLLEHNIPHANICVYNRNDDDFPNGYIIEECLPGITADGLELTEKETCSIYKKLAVLTSEIHKIKFTQYGFIINGLPDCANFTEHIENNFIYSNNKMQSFYTDDELNTIKRILVQKLKPCDNIQPCLCHIDIQLKNILVDGDNITLIDWDDARSFPAIVDIARLTLLIELEADDIEKAEIYKEAFISNYKYDDELKIYYELEPALHVWHGLVILNFFNGSKPQFNKTKAIIDEKLKLL